MKIILNKSCTFCINIWLSVSALLYGFWFIFHPHLFETVVVYQNYQRVLFVIPDGIRPEVFWGVVYAIIALANLLALFNKNITYRCKIFFIITRGMLSLVWLWAAFGVYHSNNIPASIVIYLSMFAASVFNLIKD